MATRIKDWEVPYTWWIWIEITNNHVINVLLRELNNLIHVNENRELYVDLQLDDWILPDDDFPVGITTWKILQADWRQQSWIILNWKTTSWDYVRLIYANDEKLYYDPWTWEWIEIATWESIAPLINDLNTKTFFLWSTSDLINWQKAYEWYAEWKNPIVIYQKNTYVLEDTYEEDWGWRIRLISTKPIIFNALANGRSYTAMYKMYIRYDDWAVTQIDMDFVPVSPSILDTTVDYQTPYIPLYDWSPATKKYVDDWLATKQNVLTPWTRITIDANNVISADISWVLTYKWNVTDPTALPSWATVWDCYFSESDNLMYAWDWTQWNQVWSTSPDLSNFFDKVTDDSDDIIEGSTHLFVTSSEKTTWNEKQDVLTAWQNITITNNVISATDTDTTYTQWDWIEITAQNVINNTAKFEPDNTGAMWQYLKKTNDGYAWATIPWWATYTAWSWIDITNNVISNEKPFDPTNSGTVGYVLKASGANTYYRWPESWWGWGWGWSVSDTPYWPSWDWVTNVAPSKNAIYDKIESMAAEQEVKVRQMHDSVLLTQEEMREICVWCLDSTHSAIIKRKDSSSPSNLYVYGNKYTWTDNNWHFVFFWMWESASTTHSVNGDYTTRYNWKFEIINSWSTFTLDFNDSYNVSGNYISVTPSDYTTPYIPTQQYQPATKEYVDRVASGSITWVITQDNTWTTTTVAKERVWTQAQYNAIVSWWQMRNWVIYNIIPS